VDHAQRDEPSSPGTPSPPRTPSLPGTPALPGTRGARSFPGIGPRFRSPGRLLLVASGLTVATVFASLASVLAERPSLDGESPKRSAPGLGVLSPGRPTTTASGLGDVPVMVSTASVTDSSTSRSSAPRPRPTTGQPGYPTPTTEQVVLSSIGEPTTHTTTRILPPLTTTTPPSSTTPPPTTTATAPG
jgi:hypothetical protein